MIKRSWILPLCFVFLLFSITLSAIAQTRSPRKPELIRDTDTEENTDAADVPQAKEPNPLLADESVDIGNFYFKKKNYFAAIQRYLEALEYQPDSVRAYEALARAYEKNGETAKAINTYKTFLEKNPDSPKAAEFRNRLAKLEKKAG